MVGRTAGIAVQQHASELRIHDDEIFGKTRIAQQTSGLAAWGNGGRVQEIRKSADIAVRKKSVCTGRFSQCLCCGQGGSVHQTRASKRYTVENPVKQRNVILPRSNGIKRVQDAVLENIYIIELLAEPELRGFVADPGEIHREVSSQFTLK